MRVRFAPSPTGHLHVGNARTALFNWLLARGQGGTFVLRVEDTDVERSTRESEQAILADLRWLGLAWDEGLDVGGSFGPYRQSERLEIYCQWAQKLLDAGQAFCCFCTPEEIERARQQALAEGRVPKYSGTCRQLDPADARARVDAGEAAAVRFKVPSSTAVTFDDVVRGRVTFESEMIGDPVLLRSDGRPAYNFAVVVDDILMEISHVIRGEDHISNTPRQVLLYQAFGATLPEFAHLSLVLGPDHAPLSKRHGATSVAEFRAHGYLPEALVNYLALLGWSPGDDEELLPIEELARRFALKDVNKAAGVFDPDKLAWANRHYMKLASPDRLVDETLEHFRQHAHVGQLTAEGRAFLTDIVGAAVGAVDRLEQIPERFAFLFTFDPADTLARPELRDELTDEGPREVVRQLADVLASEGRLDRERFRAAAAQVRQRTGRKGRDLFHPIRVALTGQAAGPELDIGVPLIDRGAELRPDSGVAAIMGCRERAAAFAAALAGL